MTDRTADFVAACRDAASQAARYKAKTGGGVSTQLSKPLRASKATPAEVAAFTMAASTISKDIHATAQKLSRLTRMVQKSTIFNDASPQINEMVSDIKDDITKLNEQVERAEIFIHQKRSQSGTQQAVNHSESIISHMKSELLNTTKGFKDVLQLRQDSMKSQQERRTMYGRQSVSALGKPLLYKSAAAKSGPSSAPNGDSVGAVVDLPRPDGLTESQPLISQDQIQQVLPDTAYFASRADAVQQIESHMVDLGQIFNKLATMINEQGQMVERIDDNVEQIEHNITAGQDQLMQYYASLTSNKMLMAKLFFVLLFFVVFFIAFLA